jgi:hypothetical protein
MKKGYIATAIFLLLSSFAVIIISYFPLATSQPEGGI